MRNYSLNSLLDLLEIKGLLKNRNEAEISVLCRLNKPDTFSFEMLLIYITATALYLGVIGLMTCMDFFNLIDVKNNNHQFAMSIFLSFICIVLFGFSTQLQNTHYLILQMLIRLLMGSSFLLSMHALHFMSAPFSLLIASVFTIIHYLYFNDSVIRFSAACLFGLYILLSVIPDSFALLSFAILSLFVLSVCLLDIKQKSITPLLYAGLCLIIFSPFHLLATQPGVFLLKNTNLWTVLFQINLILLMLSHLGKLKLNALKPISDSNLWLCLVFSLLCAWSPILTIAFIIILISYRWVNIWMMTAAVGLSLYFAAYYIYIADLSIGYKSIMLLGFGLVLFFFQDLIKHYQWHTER